MKWWNRIKQEPFFIRLFNWEYWSTFSFYWPLMFYGPVLAWRSGHPCFFTAANPSIYSGGFGLESKFSTIRKIPSRFRPKSVLVKKHTDFSTVKKDLQTTGIPYPLIIKPDLGYRGLLVRKLKSEQELEIFLNKYPIDFIIQEFVDYPEEFGVLYYRYPGNRQGNVSSITLKEFLKVTGDGQSTVKELVLDCPRARLQLHRLQTTHAHLLPSIPVKGEKISLGIIGNHAKGTTFINGNQHIDHQIIQTFDEISHELDGIHYGRFDIKCQSLEDLKKGQNLKILEINGVCSEPTHIYDPTRISYFGALGEILKHWKIIQEIAKTNHQKGTPYMSFKHFAKAMYNLSLYFKFIRKHAGHEAI